MNKDFMEKLWAEISRMRSSLSMLEAYRIIVYIMLFRYIDINKGMIKTYADEYSVDFLARLYGDLISKEKVINYIQEIEQNNIIPGNGIVSAGLAGMLEKADNSHVQMLFKAIAEMKLEDDQMYDIAVSLLDSIAYTHGSGMEGISLNLSLCKLEGRLLGCKEGMQVYDGFCGYGLSVNEAAVSGDIIYMQDKNKDSVAIAVILALFKGNRVKTARCGDSLVDPVGNEKFDRIVMESPIGIRYEGGNFKSIPADNCAFPDVKDGECLTLQHACARLADDGIAVVLVSAGILSKSGKIAEIREKLVSSCLDAVIELPLGVLPNAATAAAIMVLKKNREHNDIFMLNAKTFFEKSGRNRLQISDENISRLVSLYENREEMDEISSNKTETYIIEKGCNLCTSQYVISDPHSMIRTGNVVEHMEEYADCASRLAEIEKELDAVRGRFIFRK